MKKRDEEARANMKGKMSNCLVVAVVLLAVSALSGAVMCVQGNGHPSGPEPTSITIDVDPSSIPADGTSISTITARAMKDNEPSNNYILIFRITSEPREGDVNLITTDTDQPHYGKQVGNWTNDGGYAYAELKSGIKEGPVTIEVYRGNVSSTAVVTLGKVQPPVNKTNFTLEFITGYNMISLPVNDSAVTDAASFADKIGDNCTGIIKWDSAIQEYVTYLPGVPLKNFDVSGGEGYLANVNHPTDVTFN
ncbi:hypothetical protein C5S39_01310 [Candidatus Methanophagaceae archaeon]|nr:hypothetical protein C5S39_01310 [Methanophagales archaeon]